MHFSLPSVLSQTPMDYSKEAPWSGLVETHFLSRNCELGPRRLGLLGTEISAEPQTLYPGRIRVHGCPSSFLSLAAMMAPAAQACVHICIWWIANARTSSLSQKAGASGTWQSSELCVPLTLATGKQL